jgi:hypothetical protein
MGWTRRHLGRTSVQHTEVCNTAHGRREARGLTERVRHPRRPTGSTRRKGRLEHLGVPTGYHVAHSAENALQTMTRNLEKINGSLLAPCQKIDAVNTVVMPCIFFHLKNGVVQKRLLNQLHKKIKTVAKKWINLPQRASAEILYLQPDGRC